MNEVAETKSQEIIDEQVDPVLEALREEKDWFIGVGENDDSMHYFDKEQIETDFYTNISEGKFAKTDCVIMHHKDNNGNWLQTYSTLEDFSKSNFKLRTLYQPVWSHAMAGLKWGAIVGVILKLLDTFLMLLAVDAGLAFLFAIAVGVCFIPRIGWLGITAISFFMFRFSNANFFIMALTAGITGAVLGCLPGMAIGGFIGIKRKSSLPLAQDATPESENLLLKTGIIPLVSGIAIIVFYIFVFNPWLMNTVS